MGDKATGISSLPEVGQAVQVRGRLGTVRTVAAYDTGKPTGRLHLVEVEYLDERGQPEEDQLLWEVEPTGRILGDTSLPRVDEYRPDSPGALRAFLNTHRWTRLNRLREAGNVEEEPLLSVWNSAIQINPYQLEPVLRALEMPRVSLLLCDGVGLGKTIQAGLVLQELLLRRRIRRVLIVCPAMLQRQWRYELQRKFNLDFEIIDSESTFQLRRRLGIDTNPWKVSPRIITSMDYLRMPDVVQQFRQASGLANDNIPGSGNGTARAAWDLLIVDECHNFAPQAGNRSSQRTQMLHDIRFLFEHRLFLSATPHNGYTVSFTGLLELLDPVRFQMKQDLEQKDRQHLDTVRVRRLKDDVNRCSLRPPFADQLPPKQIDIRLSQGERALFHALRSYRESGQQMLEDGATSSERNLSRFIFTLLTKRLLSCPFAFARTWWRHLQTDETVEEPGLFKLAHVAMQKAESDIKSDDEKALVEEDTIRHGTAWLRQRKPELEEAIRGVTRSLEALGYDLGSIEGLGDDFLRVQDERLLVSLAKRSDSKTEQLVEWVKDNLFANGKLRNDERLIVFTEYKETLLYLQRRFQREGFDENTMRLLYGGMGTEAFEHVQREFEDPHAAVRLLLATDAASEGINMQECCRWVIHYDIPWSPTKILQRNGRVARHGQVRDVHTFYFHCDQDEDMRFLSRVARKVEQVRDDLGSVERVFDDAMIAYMRGREVSDDEFDRNIATARESSKENQDLGRSDEQEIEAVSRRAKDLLEASQHRLGITSDALIEILRTAIAVEGDGALEEIPNRPGFYRVRLPSRWEPVVGRSLTVDRRGDRMEVVFDTTLVEEENEGRRVMRVGKHQVLLRLSHPVMKQALATLSRQLHQPEPDRGIFRWSIAALHKPNIQELLIFHYYVTAINELREPLHDETISTVFRIEGDRLSPAEASFEEEILHSDLLPLGSDARLDEWGRIVRGKWPQHSTRLKKFMEERKAEFAADFEKRAKAALERELAEARESYRYRLKEIKRSSSDKEIEKLVGEITRLEIERSQQLLLRELEEDREQKQRELNERKALLLRNMEDTQRRLEKERDQRRQLLSKRYSIRDLRVLPLAVQYIIPAAKEDLVRGESA